MASMEGFLSKWTNVMKGWQYRWFVLDDNAGLLSYYTSKEKMMRGVRRGCVRLKGAVIGIDDDDDSTFTITVDGKIFHFQARDPDERDQWIRALENTILRHAHHKRWDPSCPIPTIQDFDRKLTETDAYLQILIDQIKNLETKLDKCEDEAEKNCYTVIRDKANEMLESIKHSIVLLQIAKNTAHPVNGIYHTNKHCLAAKRKHDRQRSAAGILSETSDSNLQPSSLIETPLDASIEQGIEPAVECLEEGSLQKELAMTHVAIKDSHTEVPPHSLDLFAAVRPTVSLPFPETSYSSSEEEDFFDAKDDEENPIQHRCNKKLFEDAVETLDNITQRREDISQAVFMDGNIDYDALYEDEEEEDLGSLESHGSVISHLLSQVRLGMDLTKVVLPTFILERRSLLEMYADFFAHPDLFVSIADFTDPCDRMVQVVRWYMSAFHAGRESAVARKPYNPILGEVFRCFWDVPGYEKSQADAVSDGPVPWASKDHLAFIAEQVSHHPPISAFYAEHYNKRISFCAHIWTKSKFLGLSVGVHMIGQGCISVLDYDEEYIITFPNGYGRSILSVPWVELGGSTTVTCAKTGYTANIEFLTKPFYGGKKHRVNAEILQPNEKKPFVTVAGEWNGCMNAKWNDGKTEVFVDTRKIPNIKKVVQPISSQAEDESRRLWKDVTAGLRLRDITKATEAKYLLEQKQREEARERSKTGVKWKTKFFDETGENWTYNEPLIKRLVTNSSFGASSSSAVQR